MVGTRWAPFSRESCSNQADPTPINWPRRCLMPRVAVVFCGCGRADGSEIHEAVSCLIHLARLGADYACFAPDAPQTDVINHLTGKPSPSEKRNQLVEAARLARGRIAPLASLNPGDFD